MSQPPTSSLPPSFLSKKAKILSSLSVPLNEYDDLSPKGSVDIGIRELIDEINGVAGWVTTSSCAGRISVFLEGKKKKFTLVDEESTEVENDDGDGEGEEVETRAGIGGKGGGGRWLFVSHDPVGLEEMGKEAKEKEDVAGFLGMKRVEEEIGNSSTSTSSTRDIRFIHFKFEPMILHILTSSLAQAQTILTAALQAGFRESGALNLASSSNSSEPATPMVGIRSMGLALESLIGYERDGVQVCNVPETYLRTLLEISNERFRENTKRIERLRGLLMGSQREKVERVWEDAGVRRERMRAEGLRRKEAVRKELEEKERAEKIGEGDGDEGGELVFPDENT